MRLSIMDERNKYNRKVWRKQIAPYVDDDMLEEVALSEGLDKEFVIDVYEGRKLNLRVQAALMVMAWDVREIELMKKVIITEIEVVKEKCRYLPPCRLQCN